MKKTFLLLLILIAFKGYSQEWEQIILTEQEEYFYKANTSNTAWVKIISEKTEYISETTQKEEIIDGYKLILWKFNCNGKKMGIIQALVYSKEGELLSSIKQNEFLMELDYVVPDTVGEELLQLFCKE